MFSVAMLAQVEARGYTRDVYHHLHTATMVSIREDYVAISHEGDRKNRIWLAEKEVVNDKTFIRVVKEYRFLTFVNGKYAILDYLVMLRNTAAQDAMQAQRTREDVEDPACKSEVPCKRRKAEMLDEIERVVEVQVGDVFVRVLASKCDTDALYIELGVDNVSLLLTDPPVTIPEAFVPEVTEQNVRWNKTMHAVQCRLKCASTGKYRTKTMGVKKGGTDYEVQTRTDAMARAMQAYYQEHHS